MLIPHIPIAESLLRMSASSCYYYDPHPRTDGKKILPGGGWGWSHIFSAGDKDPENTHFILTLTAEMVIKDFVATEQNRREDNKRLIITVQCHVIARWWPNSVGAGEDTRSYSFNPVIV